MRIDIFLPKISKNTFVSKIALIIALVAMLCVTAQAEILVDYDDGVVDGVHDVAILDGDFENALLPDAKLDFIDMPNWTNLLSHQAINATNTSLPSGVGGDRNAVVTELKSFGQALGHTITAGETYNVSYMWRDAYGWDDAIDYVHVILFYTDDDTLTGTATDIATYTSELSQVDVSYQTEEFIGYSLTPEAAAGKNLFVRIDADNGFGRLDNLFIEVLPKALVTLVAPAYGETDVAIAGTQLQWTVEENWACDVNLGTDPCAPGLVLVLEDYAGVAGEYSYDTGALDPSTTYYWQIDAIDPNGDVRIPGPVWNFVTAGLDPIVDSEPNSQVIFAGEDAVYPVGAYNPATYDTTGLTYQWYKYVDGVSDVELSDGADHSGTATAEMTVLVADMADEGEYYCIVTLDAETAQSQNTMLGIKTLEAHWTMDEVDYVGGLYLDISGNGHDADPNEEWVPTFTTGADGTTGTGAVTIDPITGWAEAGTWNPSENSNCLTISVWVNWNGTGDGSGIAAKRDGWGPDNGMWQLSVNEFGGLWLAGGDFSHTVGANLPAEEWHHVCATVDLDGTASMYVDGVLLETFEFSLGNKTDSPVVIGILDTDPLLRSFNGSLDDIRIYNYARTQDEIVAEYYATSNTPVCVNRPALDIDGPEGEPDCLVNIYDFALIAENWMICGMEPYAACPE